MLACVAIIRKEMANQQCKYVCSAEIEARAKVRRKTMDHPYFVSFVLFSPQAAHDQNAEKVYVHMGMLATNMRSHMAQRQCSLKLSFY